jgi:predicted RNA-binding protein (TIGR00451 family)
LFEIVWSSALKTYGEKVARWIADNWRSNNLVIVQSGTGNPRVIRLRVGNDIVDVAYYNPVTGVLTLADKGAQLIYPLVEKDYKRVVVSRKDFCEYTKGSVLAPIVMRVTSDVRPGDEVFVVDENDYLLGVGKSVVSWVDLQGLRRGEVVKLRRKIGC